MVVPVGCLLEDLYMPCNTFDNLDIDSSVLPSTQRLSSVQHCAQHYGSGDCDQDNFLLQILTADSSSTQCTS